MHFPRIRADGPEDGAEPLPHLHIEAWLLLAMSLRALAALLSEGPEK
jgi:hypothetical protein